MIVELGLKALHEPGVIRGRRQLRKHGIAWIMGGVEGDIQGGAVGNPIKGEGEPFRSLCAQVKLSDLVVVITALSRFFYFKTPSIGYTRLNFFWREGAWCLFLYLYGRRSLELDGGL